MAEPKTAEAHNVQITGSTSLTPNAQPTLAEKTSPFTVLQETALKTLVPTIVRANASKGVKVTPREVRQMFEKGLLEIIFQQDGTAAYGSTRFANRLVSVLS
jgi:hypothetical protein